MFERFTEPARQVVVLAQDEARALRHNYIGTEHILLGLLRQQHSLAAQALGSLGITLERVRDAVTRIVGRGEEVTSGQIPFTPRAKKVLELALREALSLGHDYIAPGHILLGLLRENEGVAKRILLDFGADAEKIRNTLARLFNASGGRLEPRAWAEVREGPGPEWIDGLGPLLQRLAVEIRHRLEREPDTGDLLLVLACARDTPAGETLAKLGINIDTLWGRIEQVRRSPSSARAQLARRIEEVRAAKERAIEAQQFDTAAQMRDQERELRQQALAQPPLDPALLGDVLKTLGIPGPPEEPPSTADST